MPVGPFENLHENYQRVLREIELIWKTQEKIMADVSKLNAAVTTLGAHVDALIASQGPSNQAAVDSSTTAVQAVDAKVVAATPAAA